MKQFFKFVFATIIGLFLFALLSILIIFIVATAADHPAEIERNSLLHIRLDVPVVELASDNFLDNLDPFATEIKQKLSLKKDILDNIKKARTDDRIKGIFLDISSIQAGIATVDEIRNALTDFKESGKFIVSYSELYTQKAYFLASVADEIYLYPEGYLEFRGLKTHSTFLKGLFGKLEIEPQLIRGKNNRFKSAGETLILDKMSDANREQTIAYVSSIWNHILNKVSESRKIDKTQLQIIADSLLIRRPSHALEHKLVDGVIYKDELLAKLKEKSGAEDEKKIKYVTLKQYSKANDENDEGGNYRKPKIAVVFAQGSIVSGDGDDESIGSEKISEAIRDARKDEKVKAIVLRVNSPGGSALASDVIWREVNIARETKPVIVSMGDVAASGGYYIACMADTIVASPVTITGSIGVFGVVPNTKKFFNNKLGITFDGVKTSKYADLGDLTRPLTPDETIIIQQEVDNIYDSFIAKVANGRGISVAQVDSLGQGRVWSGTDGMRNGLVDVSGGINTAIEITASKVGLTDYRIAYYPKQKDPIEQLLKELTGSAKASLLRENMGEYYSDYQYILSVVKMSGVQARMPFETDVY